jgi:hypothetical protein
MERIAADSKLSVAASERHAEKVAAKDTDDRRKIGKLGLRGPGRDVERMHRPDAVQLKADRGDLGAKLGHKSLDFGGRDAEGRLTKHSFHASIFAGFLVSPPAIPCLRTP